MRWCLHAQAFRFEAARTERAPVRRKTRRSPIMARQVSLYRDAVCTRRRSGMKRRGKCGTTVGGLTRAPASVVQMSSNRIARTHCAAKRLRIRGAMCVCAHLCSRIALTGFPREAADAQKDPPKPDHGSAGQAVSRCCLHAQAFGLEAAQTERAPVRRKTRRSPIMARQVRLYRDAVCTRRRSDSGVADAQKDPPKPDHGSAGQAASRCCLHAQAFRLEARAENAEQLSAA